MYACLRLSPLARTGSSTLSGHVEPTASATLAKQEVTPIPPAKSHGNWQQYMSRKDNKPYWYNSVTGENTWTRPTNWSDTDSPVEQPRDKRRAYQTEEATDFRAKRRTQSMGDKPVSQARIDEFNDGKDFVEERSHDGVPSWCAERLRYFVHFDRTERMSAGDT
jgi:hypothetical protein